MIVPRPFLCISLLFLVSCQSKQLSVDELRKYVSDKENGLRQLVDINDYRIEVTYRPVDLLIAQQVGENTNDTSRIAQLKKQYNRYHYFVMSLSYKNRDMLNELSDQASYNEMLQTLAFRMAEYVNITVGTDTVNLAHYQLDRTYGMANSTNLLFAFERSKFPPGQEVKFNIDDFGLDIGPQHLLFQEEGLSSVPTADFLSQEN